MSNEMEGLTRINGWFSCPGSGGEWQMWRNKDGFIELYRTKRAEFLPEEQPDGTTKMVRTYLSGLERRVTMARDPSELDAYFTSRPKPKSRRDPNQIDLIKQAEELNRSHEQS